MKKSLERAIKSKHGRPDVSRLQQTKSISPILPESSRINSQFHVMRGIVNRSKTLKINKFANPNKGKDKVMSDTKKKYVNCLRDDFQINKERMIKSTKKLYDEKKYSNISPRNSKYSLSIKSKILNSESRNARILVRDDACLNEKELNLSNSINIPIPGLVIKSQFNKEYTPRLGPSLYEKQNKDNYLLQKVVSMNRSLVYNEPKRQALMHIRPHLKCHH